MAESRSGRGPEFAAPVAPGASWLVDEMLGKLARYLRILGTDAEYVQGLSDDEVLAKLQESHRILLTRDVRLASRASRSTLLRAVEVRDQLRELWAVHPSLPRTPRFTRCTRCNGELVAAAPAARVTSGGQAGIRESAGLNPQFTCLTCGHRYWRGSHTEHLERDLASWSGSPP
ncbi:MAG: Mut7-C RNAse domain-containing protein [Thermoplasmata archaeon]|nr:Mut7-C RNAse domain-containing protein [Thermoplasmata archaeon]